MSIYFIYAPELCFVRILHNKPCDDRGKTLRYLVIICHANDSGMEKSRSMVHQAVEVQGSVAMEDCHHSALWLLDKHFQAPFNELMFRFHAIHVVAEWVDIVFVKHYVNCR